MGKDIPLEKRIILALDVPTVEEAKQTVKQFENRIRFYKIGLQLFLAGWFNIVDWILARDLEVFLDLKFFDVPAFLNGADYVVIGRPIRNARDPDSLIDRMHRDIREALQMRGF